MNAITITPETAMPAVWIAWVLTWLVAAAWSDRSVKRPAIQHQLVYRVLVAGGLALLFGMSPSRRRVELPLWHTPEPVGWLMVALAIGGFVFVWWARIHLGRLWSGNVASKAAHRLVDTGPYGIVRHPIYTGITVAQIAAASLRGTLLGWVGAGLMTIGWYIKARLEEHFMREQLGSATYGDYMRRVPMLVPLLPGKR